MSSQNNHICATCEEQTGPDGHMCTPIGREDQQCEWCGALIVNKRHLCEGKLQELLYICNSCGRTAVSGEHLCEPVKIK